MNLRQIFNEYLNGEAYEGEVLTGKVYVVRSSLDEIVEQPPGSFRRVGYYLRFSGITLITTYNPGPAVTPAREDALKKLEEMQGIEIRAAFRANNQADIPTCLAVSGTHQLVKPDNKSRYGLVDINTRSLP